MNNPKGLLWLEDQNDGKGPMINEGLYIRLLRNIKRIMEVKQATQHFMQYM